MEKWINLEELKSQHKKTKKYKNNSKKNYNKKMYLPKDTASIIISEKYFDNLNLYLNKLAVHNFETKNKFPKIFSPKKDFNNYYNQIKKSLFKTDELKLKINDKLIIGLGYPSVYETSITLHHIYGVPYIPGSAIKGSFRSYIIETYFDKNEEKALKEKWFVNIFGNQEKQGKVIFFDAFSNDVEIQKDIMNSHYPDYYDGNEHPTDDQNPRPINFLAVTGTFKFMFGVKKDFKIEINKNRCPVLKFIKENLEKSLKEFGIGAKTAVGYGYFKKNLN